MPNPESTFVHPAAAGADEDYQEWQEETADMARKQRREAARTNKVAKFLGQSFWKTDRTWPSLYWKFAGWQSRVEMFFPALNLAVDRYARPTSMDRQEAAFKAGALKAEGVKYVALFPETSIQELSRHI